MKWVTRERPRSTALPAWLIARFIDKGPGIPLCACGHRASSRARHRSDPVRRTRCQK